jgi:hypothetical protein
MYYKLKTQKFKKSYNNNININISYLKKIIKDNISECPFSTFQYIFGSNSKESVKKSQGNCVAMSMYLKNKLKKHNIKSFLIPATIPNAYKSSGYLDISHVALAIILNDNKVLISDASFYFLEPMIISDNYSNLKSIKSYDIYGNKYQTLKYKTYIQHKEKRFNEYQSLPKNIYYVNTYDVLTPNDSWNYYLLEILNPDEAISSFYITIKNLPFITYLDENLNFKLHLKFTSKNNIFIKSNNVLLYSGSPYSIPPNVIDTIKPYLIRYLGEDFYKYFTLPDIKSHYYISDK